MADAGALGSYFDIPLSTATGLMSVEWQRFFIDFVTESLVLPSGTGIIVKDSSDTTVSRSVVPGSSKVNITNGTGVSGNISVDVDGTQIDHDTLTNYSAAQHIDWTSTSNSFNTTGTAHTGQLTVNGNIIVSGRVDNRDIGVDGTKLDTIETSAEVSDMKLISTATASSSSAIAFTDLSSTYAAYVIYFDSVAPATDNVNFRIRTSTNNGSSYDSGALNYYFGGFSSTEGGTLAASSAAGTDGFYIVYGSGNATNETCAGYVKIFNPSKLTYTRIETSASTELTDGTVKYFNHHGKRISANDVDAVQFTMSSGNISAGNFYLYGLRAS